MALVELGAISKEVINIIIYTQSPSFEYYIMGILRDRFKVSGDFIVSVDTMKGLRGAKLDSHVAPILCDKWLIHVKADKIAEKDIMTSLLNNTRSGVTVYWVSKYSLFKKLSSSSEVKQLGVYCRCFSFSMLSIEDIISLHKSIAPQSNMLSSKLLDFVCDGYRYDPQAVFDLFTLMKSGETPKSKRDIITLVGLGGGSVNSLLLRILSNSDGKFEDLARANKRLSAEKRRNKAIKEASENNLDLSAVESGLIKKEEELSRLSFERKKLSKLRSCLVLLDDLHVSMEYRTVRNFMLDNLDGFIEMKQLQVMGVYGKLNMAIPDAFNEKRLARLKRFERVIQSSISMSRLLALKMCLLRYNNENAQISILQSISDYFNITGTVNV